MLEQIELVYNPFWPLLVDAIDLTNRSTVEDAPSRDVLARTSILCTCLLIEAAANCCIDALPHQMKLREALDKLPALAKLELFLNFTVAGSTLDRGDHRVQEVDELRKVRDSLVHPKRSVEKVRSLETAPDIGELANELWPALRISRNPSRWAPNDAIRALGTVTSFLCFFFVDKCLLDAKQTASLLVHDMRIAGTSLPSSPEMDRRGAVSMYGAFQIPIKKWKLKFDFLGIGKNGPSAIWMERPDQSKKGS